MLIKRFFKGSFLDKKKGLSTLESLKNVARQRAINELFYSSKVFLTHRQLFDRFSFLKH